jgi:regulatory protein
VITESSLEMRALRYLARREYSRVELEKKLVSSSPATASAEVSDLLDKLEQRGFLSARRVVEQVIQMRRHKFGSQRIVHELKQKGIDEHLINDALPDLKETELATAYDVWRKKFNVSPANIKERGKQTRFLLSRGFTMTIIHQIFTHADQG